MPEDVQNIELNRLELAYLKLLIGNRTPNSELYRKICAAVDRMNAIRDEKLRK